MASFSKLIELTPAAWKQLAVNIQVVTSREESGAHLGLHGVTDGDVSLHCEGGEGESRGVHGQELAVDHQGAASTAILIMSLYGKCERAKRPSRLST